MKTKEELIEKWESYKNGARTVADSKAIEYADKFINDLNQLDEPEVLSQELPVIPKFVAELLRKNKKDNFKLIDTYGIALERGSWADKKLVDWLQEDWTREDIFARAWLDGYEIEDESKYVIRHKSGGGYYLIEFNLGEESPASYGTEKEEWITFDTKREAELIAEFSEWAGEIERVDTND